MLTLLACTHAALQLTHDTAPSTDTAVDTAVDTDSGHDTDTGHDSDSGDTSVTGDGLVLTVDPDIVTMVHATWKPRTADEVHVEYRFEGDAWLVAPAIDDQTAVLLGIPSETPVDARLAVTTSGSTTYSDVVSATTGTLPSGLPLPDVTAWDATKGYDAAYAMISTDGGSYQYAPPYWNEIFDREGRIVWYQKVASNMMTFYPTISRDGTHIWYESEDIFGMGHASPSVTRETLDLRWSVDQPVDQLGEGIAEGPDSGWFYEYRSGSGHELRELSADGTNRTVWDCGAWMKANGMSGDYCDMNTCNWSPVTNTVLVSQFYSSTVFEIDVSTGEIVRQMGQITKGNPYSFDPSDALFDYQHDPYWTDAGTLLVSTHIKGVSGRQRAEEFTVDDVTKTLHRVWMYESDDLWATQVGEAIRLPNGNTIQGYGQDGAVREVTTDGTVVWEVHWNNSAHQAHVVGHLSLIPDLYALNVGD